MTGSLTRNRQPSRSRFGEFWLLAAGIAAVKLLYLWVWGVSYEMDTATYLSYSPPAHHPPAYSIFLQYFAGLRQGVVPVAVAQIVLFALAAAAFAQRIHRTPRSTYLTASLLAVDPVTAFICVNLMSEALFVPLLLLWLAFLFDYCASSGARRAIPLLCWVGVLLAALYSTRLVAIVFVPFLLAVIALQRQGWKRALLHVTIVLVVFQAFLVPVKVLYLQRFGSFSVTLYSGASLWNNASPLYPGSSVRDSPRTDFEKFLATRDPAEFTTFAALQTEATNGTGYAYDTWVTQRAVNPRALTEFERQLGRTATRIILESPLDYVRLFVIPNYLQTFRTVEVVAIDARVSALMKRLFDYNQAHDVVYRPWVWRIWFALLCLATAGCALRRPADRLSALLLGFCWYYFLLLPWAAAVFIRFFLILAPFILTASGLQLRRREAGPA